MSEAIPRCEFRTAVCQSLLQEAYRSAVENLNPKIATVPAVAAGGG